MNLAGLADRAQDVVAIGGELVFRCPRHGEQCAGARESGGRLELWCDRGCTGDELSGLLGIRGSGTGPVETECATDAVSGAIQQGASPTAGSEHGQQEASDTAANDAAVVQERENAAADPEPMAHARGGNAADAAHHHSGSTPAGSYQATEAGADEASQDHPSPADQPASDVPPPTDSFLRRIPPQNIDAEQSVLGALFIDHEVYHQVIKVMTGDDFYRESHRLIWRAVGELIQAGKVPIDAVTLCAELKAYEVLEQIGGPAYIAELAVRVPVAGNAPYYAEIVHAMAVKRRVAAAATQIATLAYNGVSADALVGEAQRLLEPHLSDTSGNELAGLVRTKIEPLSWGSLRQRREAQTRDWAVDGWLARGEISSWSGKVEGGKTTLMRELTMCVVRGEPFLGRPTTRGRVVYAMLDADGEDVTFDEFQKLGFDEGDAGMCAFLFEPMLAQMKNGFEQFVRLVRDFEPSLVIIDPYPRLKMIQDFFSYTNTYLMGELSALAKLARAHLALPGHIPRGRSDDDDVATAGFGSISFSGGVNARFVVTNRDGIHTIRTSRGKAAGFVPLEGEFILEQDSYTSRINLGAGWSWKDKAKPHKDEVYHYLMEHADRPYDVVTLAQDMRMQKSIIRTTLRMLAGEGRIRCEGEGKNRNPYIYAALEYKGEMTLEEVRRQ